MISFSVNLTEIDGEEEQNNVEWNDINGDNYEEYINDNDNSMISEYSNFIVEIGNNDKHIYFAGLCNSGNGILFNEQQYEHLDIKSRKSIIYAPGSTYNNKSYEELHPLENLLELNEIPKEINDKIGKEPSLEKTIKYISDAQIYHKEEEKCIKTSIDNCFNVMYSEFGLKLVNNILNDLDSSYHDFNEELINSSAFEIYDEVHQLFDQFSEESTYNYNCSGNAELWNNANKLYKEGITIKSLFFYSENQEKKFTIYCELIKIYDEFLEEIHNETSSTLFKNVDIESIVYDAYFCCFDDEQNISLLIDLFYELECPICNQEHDDLEIVSNIANTTLQCNNKMENSKIINVNDELQKQMLECGRDYYCIVQNINTINNYYYSGNKEDETILISDNIEISIYDKSKYEYADEMNSNMNGLLNMNIKNFAYVLIYEYFDDLEIIKPDELWLCDESCIWSSIEENNTIEHMINDVISDMSKIENVEEKIIKHKLNEYDKKCIREQIYWWINEAAITLENEENSNIFNSNHNIFAFNNGLLYDTTIKEIREIEEQDYITFTCDHPYMENIEENKIIKVKQFFESIMPNINERDYILELIALLFKLDNSERQIHFFSAVGSNGKTILLTLIQHAFGKYVKAMNSSILTSEINDPSEASGYLLDMELSRLMYCSEINPGQKLNNNLIERLCGGGDVITARKLYEENEEFQINSKFIVVCNSIPEISNTNDNAFFDRFVNITFPVEFFKDDRTKYIEEYEIENENMLNNLEIGNPNMNKFVKELAPALFHLLIPYYEEYIQEGLKLTESMMMNKSNYGFATFGVEENNEIKQFFFTHIEECPNSYYYVQWTHLFDQYMIYLNDEDMQNIAETQKGKAEIEHQFEILFGENCELLEFANDEQSFIRITGWRFFEFI